MPLPMQFNVLPKSANPAVNWTAYTLRVPAASYFERWAHEEF